jgi:hypothetical protein
MPVSIAPFSLLLLQLGSRTFAITPPPALSRTIVDRRDCLAHGGTGDRTGHGRPDRNIIS